MQWYAGAAPLLTAPLTARTAETTASETCIPPCALCQVRLGLPPEVRAGVPGKISRPMGSGTNKKAWGRNTAKLGKQAKQGKHTDETRQQTLDDAGPVLEKGLP